MVFYLCPKDGLSNCPKDGLFNLYFTRQFLLQRILRLALRFNSASKSDNSKYKICSVLIFL